MRYVQFAPRSEADGRLPDLRRSDREALHAGLDVSFDKTSVCIVNEAGAYVAEAKVASDPAAFSDYLHATGLSFGRVGLETSALSQWLQTPALRSRQSITSISIFPSSP
jgi:hypothetical protein